MQKEHGASQACSQYLHEPSIKTTRGHVSVNTTTAQAILKLHTEIDVSLHFLPSRSCTSVLDVELSGKFLLKKHHYNLSIGTIWLETIHCTERIMFSIDARSSWLLQQRIRVSTIFATSGCQITDKCCHTYSTSQVIRHVLEPVRCMGIQHRPRTCWLQAHGCVRDETARCRCYKHWSTGLKKKSQNYVSTLAEGEPRKITSVSDL